MLLPVRACCCCREARQGWQQRSLRFSCPALSLLARSPALLQGACVLTEHSSCGEEQVPGRD